MSSPSLLSLLGRLKASGSHTIFDIAPARHQPVAASLETVSSETASSAPISSTAASSPFEVPSAILAASIVAKGDLTSEEAQKFAVRLQRQQLKIMTARAAQEAAKRRG
jgi:hypothetical protein